jgi:hypothetical protein
MERTAAEMPRFLVGARQIFGGGGRNVRGFQG